MQTNLMQCAAYGLSTDRLTPHPFNLCSNAGSTHTSISQTQPLDMTLSMCTQLLWSTMARPVLSGTCPVKTAVWSWPPCCSSVSGSLQSSYSLLRHLYVEQQLGLWRLTALPHHCGIEMPTAVLRSSRHHRTFFARYLQEEARGLHSAGSDQISCDAGLNSRIKHCSGR